MTDDVSIILEKLYRQELNFTQTIKKMSNLLLEKVSKDIYDEIMKGNKNDN